MARLGIRLMQPETGSIISVPPTTLSLPFFFPFCMAVEGLWSPTLCYTPHWSYGGGLWPNRCRVWARMKSPFEKILPLLFCKGGHCLWCGRSGHIQLHEEMMLRFFFVFVFLFMYYIVFRICCDFQPNWNDVLKDFTMWWEVNTFISVQHLSHVLCLVNLCSLTISQKKNKNKKIKPRLSLES